MPFAFICEGHFFAKLFPRGSAARLAEPLAITCFTCFVYAFAYYGFTKYIFLLVNGFINIYCSIKRIYKIVFLRIYGFVFLHLQSKINYDRFAEMSIS